MTDRPTKPLKRIIELASLGTCAAYLYLVYFVVGSLTTAGEPPGWGALGNTFEAAMRYVSGALFLFPLVGFGAGLVVGAAVYGLTALLGLDEKRGYRVGAVTVGAVGFVLLGLPWREVPFYSAGEVVAFLILLLLGAGFTWVALRRREIISRASRVCLYLLGGATVLWLLFVFAIPVGFTPARSPDLSPPGPNIVVLLSDAHRADANTIYGGAVPTPNLERFARRAVVFERCFSPGNWTIPGVIGLMSGLAPDVADSDSQRSISPLLPSLPEDLQNLGYRTWTTIANPAISMRHTLYRGWDYYSLLSVRFYNQGFLEDYSLSGYTRLAGYFSQLMVRVFYHNYRLKTPEVGLKMLEELNPAGGDFAYIHLNDPHTPYRPYERYRPKNAQRVGRYLFDTWEHDLTKNDLSDLTPPEKARIRELYDGEIRFSDEYLGRVMDILDERGLWDTTALIFLADHGEEFEEHGGYTHGDINLHHELTHIPLVVWWPGAFDQAGRRIAQPVSLYDIYPTICELVGIPYEPERLNGVSLVPLPDPDRPVFAQRFPNSPEAQRYSDFVVQGRAALHLDYTTGVEELYLDYYANPEDVSAEHPELVERLRGLITEWHLRNAALQEYYGTAMPDAAQDPVIQENLRAIGYIQ